MKLICFILALMLILAGCNPSPSLQPDPTLPSKQAEETIQQTLPKETTQPPETTQSTDAAPIQKDPLEELLDSMTIEERVGQLFLVAAPGKDTLSALETYPLGGLVLFWSDFADQTPDSMVTLLTGYQNASNVPLFLAVDEEGGTVCRVSSHSAFRHSRFPSPRHLFRDGGMGLLLETEEEKCKLLRSLHININLAPVCDITTDPNAFMYSRSLGLSPHETGLCIANMVQLMQDNHIGSVLKHFPGYGNNTDTHVAMAVDNRSLDQLESVDFVPFQAGIDAGCGGIMVSHTVVNAMDSTLPASLSPAVHTYLRDKMGYDGVIMTDDLKMDAIADHFGTGEAAVLAVLAGNDLLCTSDYKESYPAVLDAVIAGRIPEGLLNTAVIRILRWKQTLGLIVE